ncbi:hypothetical protein Taro_044798 [Colocasia esculenta]|uniref:Uncharacterized protein n=1 Tax=Colocasia esculenta TaxID=4460 RepID=A0A843WUX6_COLES|nr:hypothetical protein [Colocasia esculenta]
MALLGVFGRGVVRACACCACLGYKPAVPVSVGGCLTCSLFARCFALEGLSRLEAPDRWFCKPFLGAVYGGTGVCSSLASWRARGPGWFYLWALNLAELFLPDLVEVCDVGSCVMRLWSHVVARRVHAESCFRFMFDSAGSAGVVFDPTLVVGRGITLFRCFVVLCSRSVGGGATFGVPGGVREESVAAIAGSACYECGCWFTSATVGFIIGLRIHVGVSRRLRDPTCGVAFTSAGLLSVEPVEVVNSGEVLLEFFYVGSGGSENCFAVVLVEVHRLVALCSGDGFPELLVVVLVHSGGFFQNGALVVLVEVVRSGEGSSPDRPLSLLAVVLPRRRLLALLVEVLPRAALWLFWLSLLFLSVEMS